MSNQYEKSVGTVAFVGAGPGDPDLLTLRGAKLLAGAEAVVIDVMPGEPFTAHAPEDAEIHDASELDHGERERLVVDLARSGRRVVRLVNGDPSWYGGMAEEAGACSSEGISFEIVPGVSAVHGVPTYAGIPVAASPTGEVRVANALEHDVDWASFGSGDATLVVLNGVQSIEQIAEELVRAGRSEDTPVAITRNGTTTEQSTLVSTLGRVAADVKAAELKPPAVAVVGEAVGLRDTLSWFETKPLFGWRVLVPRTKEQAAALSETLRGYGAVPEVVPTISVEPPRTPQQLERAIRGLVTGRYQWVAFTSTNAVRAVRERFEEYGLDARAFAGVKVAAVGEQTAVALKAFGVKPDLVPGGPQSSEGLLEVWPPYDPDLDPINRVFLPRADIATDTLVAGTRELGWEVDDVTAYRTVRASPPPAPIREAIKTGGFDAVLFTSSSTVRNLVGIAGKPHATTVIGAIGPQTARTAEEYGLRVDVMAPTPSAIALAEALAEFGGKQRLSAVRAGEPVLRPSQQRRGRRRSG